MSGHDRHRAPREARRRPGLTAALWLLGGLALALAAMLGRPELALVAGLAAMGALRSGAIGRRRDGPESRLREGAPASEGAPPSEVEPAPPIEVERAPPSEVEGAPSSECSPTIDEADPEWRAVADPEEAEIITPDRSEFAGEIVQVDGAGATEAEPEVAAPTMIATTTALVVTVALGRSPRPPPRLLGPDDETYDDLSVDALVAGYTRSFRAIQRRLADQHVTITPSTVEIDDRGRITGITWEASVPGDAGARRTLPLISIASLGAADLADVRIGLTSITVSGDLAAEGEALARPDPRAQERDPFAVFRQIRPGGKAP